ncbi:S-adenosylmethionine decarboxylase [Dehalococcoidales bacterium]|nr:S-adenosylmethionine decarboxylase [Dehalococcoidales bacterium]
MHLIIDGYGSNSDILQSEEFIYQLLDQYPAEIGMTKIAPPYVLRYVGTKPEEWGISGFVLIAESHISIHTFVERCYVNIDIFSCKSFDADRVIKDLTHKLHLTEVKARLLARDMESSTHLEETSKIALLKW